MAGLSEQMVGSAVVVGLVVLWAAGPVRAGGTLSVEGASGVRRDSPQAHLNTEGSVSLGG